MTSDSPKLYCLVCCFATACRFIFFNQSEVDSDISEFEVLARSDRRALQSVASVLRIDVDDDDDDADDNSILDVVADLADLTAGGYR